MKKNILVNGLILILLLSACKKDTQIQTNDVILSAKTDHRHLKQTNMYSSDVAIKWMNLQLRLMTATTGVANVAFVRPYAYSGIALYEAVDPVCQRTNRL